jgi:hypothetical protein
MESLNDRDLDDLLKPVSSWKADVDKNRSASLGKKDNLPQKEDKKNLGDKIKAKLSLHGDKKDSKHEKGSEKTDVKKMKEEEEQSIKTLKNASFKHLALYGERMFESFFVAGCKSSLQIKSLAERDTYPPEVILHHIPKPDHVKGTFHIS